jgi:NAD(P)-dependent dehydrogenase (short-subunit alcohol dehydrogenase family)
MTNDDDVRALLELADRLDGPTRLLVNNAGGGGHIPPHFPDAAPAQWGTTLDLNLRGPMLATQLVPPAMSRAGGGAVVNVASTAGLGLAPYHSPEYGAAKAGLIRFTTCPSSGRARAQAQGTGLCARACPAPRNEPTSPFSYGQDRRCWRDRRGRATPIRLPRQTCPREKGLVAPRHHGGAPRA